MAESSDIALESENTIGLVYTVLITTGSSESYSILTTLPDPMTFIIAKLPAESGDSLLIGVFFTHGSQSFTPSSVAGGMQNGQSFNIIPPTPGTSWYAFDLVP